MCAYSIKTADVYDFTQLPNPLEVGEQPLSNGIGGYGTHIHPQVGTLRYRNISFPHLHVTDMHWNTVRDIQLINEIPSDSINLIFQLKGANKIAYSELEHHLDVDKGLAYLIYNPDGTNICNVEQESELNVLSVSLDKEFFADAIGVNTPWAERVHKNLEQGRTFSGANHSIRFDARMQQLITGIQDYNSNTPLSNMIFQAQVMELVGLHLGQIESPHFSEEVSRADSEKLYNLKAYLDIHFLSVLSLSSLSRMFFINEFKVKKGFKIMFGVSVFAYLRKLRMEHAMFLLQEGKLNIDEIAYLLGYEHPQHFSSAFKKFSGLNPSSFK